MSLKKDQEIQKAIKTLEDSDYLVVKCEYCCDCKFFMTVDEGYSSYTVTDTICHCLKNLNPHFPCSESYSWELGYKNKKVPQLLVAMNCDEYNEGEGVHLYIDNSEEENLRDVDPEVLEAYESYGL